MSKEKIYEKQPGFVAANLGEELALLDMAKGAYLGFNATAAHLWRLLDEPRTLDGLCQAMMLEFDVDAARCRGEVEELLGQLVADGMVKIRDDEVA
jgi:hypothetical protein